MLEQTEQMLEQIMKIVEQYLDDGITAEDAMYKITLIYFPYKKPVEVKKGAETKDEKTTK
jgi:hypothetical protein